MRPEQHRKRAAEGFEDMESGHVPASCRQVQADLPAFLDDDLSISRRQAVQAHLDSCEACNIELATYRDLERTLAQARLAIPSAGDLRPGFYARLSATEKAHGSGFASFRRWLIDWRVVIPTLTAASLLIGLWQGQHLQTSGNSSHTTVLAVAKARRSEQKESEQKESEQKESEQNGVSRLDIGTALAKIRGRQTVSPTSVAGKSRVSKRERVARIARDSSRLRRVKKSPQRERQHPLVVAANLSDHLAGAKSLPEADTKVSQALRMMSEAFPRGENDTTRSLSLNASARRANINTPTTSNYTYDTNRVAQNKTSLVVLVDEGVDIQVKDRVRDFTDGMHGNSLEYTSTGKRILNLAVGDEGAETDSKASADSQGQGDTNP